MTFYMQIILTTFFYHINLCYFRMEGIPFRIWGPKIVCDCTLVLIMQKLCSQQQIHNISSLASKIMHLLAKLVLCPLISYYYLIVCWRLFAHLIFYIIYVFILDGFFSARKKENNAVVYYYMIISMQT